MKKILLFLLISFNIQLGLAAQVPFNIALEPVNITGLGGLQSFAFGQHEGKWLLVGGRLDGLHRRQPWASFDLAGHNNQLIVVDPVSLQRWSAPLTALPASIQEQLSATNMNFYQEGDYLYCIGGYGYSASAGDHTTFPFLTAIEVPAVIDAIIHNNHFAPYFRQITDPEFQVTGGRLKKIYDVYHLLGGQKFLGRYNPMNNPTFTQAYTNAIRRFTLEDDGSTITIRHLPPFTDANNLHRRDYNAEPQILPDGAEGITLFSGVFQPNVDLPFLNSVTVDSNSYAVDDTFQQYYNHYHCAVVPLYSARNNQMHTVFFGGIAQYYDQNGTLVQDDQVPFVKTIARVTRAADGSMAEYKLPIEMPDFLGAGAEFIPNKTIPHYPNEVLILDEITTDSTLIGYIFGGINSSAANIFWINDGTQSTAHQQIYKVYLTNTGLPTATHGLNEQSKGSLQMQVYPNPGNGNLVVNYNLKKADNVRLQLTDQNGSLLESVSIAQQPAGANSYQYQVKKPGGGKAFYISLETSYERAIQKVIVQ